MNNYSTEQLEKIVDDAPEGADLYCVGDANLEQNPYHISNIDGTCSNDIKLSDIRAELLARPRKDINVTLSAESADMKGVDGSEKREFKSNNYQARLSEAKAHIESLPEWQRQGLNDAMNASHRIDEPSAVESIVEFIANPGNVQPDSITAQLDPAKCHKVDPTVYDAPTDSPRDNFDAMSESHRSPACKCHEFPIDVELKPDPFQQAKDKQHKEISQGKCGDFIAGYDRGFLTAWNEQQERINDLKEELELVLNDWNSLTKAIHAKSNGTAVAEARELYERANAQKAEIARLEGEQGE